MKDLFKFKDTVTDKWITGKIVERIELDQAELLLLEIDDFGKLSVIVYENGEYFVPKDWQDFQPTNKKEIAEIDWINQWGRPAIMLNNLPRTFI